jgi:hypothetical protein
MHVALFRLKVQTPRVTELFARKPCQCSLFLWVLLGAGHAPGLIVFDAVAQGQYYACTVQKHRFREEPGHTFEG